MDSRPRPIMLIDKSLPIKFKCFWAVLKNLTHYAQYYAHNHCNYDTVHIKIY